MQPNLDLQSLDRPLRPLLLILPMMIILTMVVMLLITETTHGASERSHVQLVSVQMTLDLDDYWTRGDFETKVQEVMEEVAGHIDPTLPTLVAFPEDVGLMLVAQGMQRRLSGIDSIATAIETSIKAHLLPLTVITLWRNLSWVPSLFLYKHRTIAETYFEVFSRMALEYGVYLVAGSVVLPPYEIVDGVVQWQKRPTEHQVYNTSYLFGPDGKVIGKQDKVHLIELEREAALDLSQGSLDDLQVFDTPLGRIGIAICLDAFEDDVIERLVAGGTQILVQPSANPGPWSVDQQLDWLRSSHDQTYRHERFDYAINPMMNGPLWDIAFFGQSSVVAKAPGSSGVPLGYSGLDPSVGFIEMASSDRSEEVLVAVVPHPDQIH